MRDKISTICCERNMNRNQKHYAVNNAITAVSMVVCSLFVLEAHCHKRICFCEHNVYKLISVLDERTSCESKSCE